MNSMCSSSEESPILNRDKTSTTNVPSSELEDVIDFVCGVDRFPRFSQNIFFRFSPGLSWSGTFWVFSVFLQKLQICENFEFDDKN